MRRPVLVGSLTILLSSCAREAPTPAAAKSMRIEAECRTGPIPAPPGKQPITSRSVAIEPDGTLKKTTRYLKPPTDETTSRLAEPDLERIRGLAQKVLDKADHAHEQPVPDGTVCTLDLWQPDKKLRLVSPHPSSSPELGPLVSELVALLP